MRVRVAAATCKGTCSCGFSVVNSSAQQLLKLSMASGSHYYTASEVGDLVAAGEDDDTEFLFPGSDDDFDAGLDEELDPLDREQGKYTCVMNKRTIILYSNIMQRAFLPILTFPTNRPLHQNCPLHQNRLLHRNHLPHLTHLLE